MTKLAIIPFTVLLQTLFYGRSFSTPVKATLGVLLLGVAVATVNDVELNFLGTVVSCGAIVLTCVSQIWTGTMQKAHTVSSTQLLHGAAPLMGATLLAVGIPLDRMLMTPAGELFTFSVPSCTYIVLSCIIAVSVNFSTFLVIGRCDAVTYQVLGHLKTVLILVLGFVVLKNPANPRAIAGIVLAMVGMMVRARARPRYRYIACRCADLRSPVRIHRRTRTRRVRLRRRRLWLRRLRRRRRTRARRTTASTAARATPEDAGACVLREGAGPAAARPRIGVQWPLTRLHLTSVPPAASTRARTGERKLGASKSSPVRLLLSPSLARPCAGRPKRAPARRRARAAPVAVSRRREPAARRAAPRPPAGRSTAAAAMPQGDYIELARKRCVVAPAFRPCLGCRHRRRGRAAAAAFSRALRRAGAHVCVVSASRALPAGREAAHPARWRRIG